MFLTCQSYLHAECPVYYRGCLGDWSAFSKCLCSFFGGAVRHVEHPGPYTSFSPQEAQTQAEHPQIAQHFPPGGKNKLLKIRAGGTKN